MGKLEKLLEKRKALELEIQAAELAEKRKDKVLSLAEKAGILLLSDEVLTAAFKKIADENKT